MADGVWTSEDAWVLTAVALGRRGDLRGLLSGGDVSNHDILHRAALERGLGRLVASGLVWIEQGPRFHLTLLGRKVARKAKGGTVEMLVAMPRGLIEVPRREGHIAISAQEYDDALAAYYNR